jgi:hypothetical protein
MNNKKDLINGLTEFLNAIERSSELSGLISEFSIRITNFQSNDKAGVNNVERIAHLLSADINSLKDQDFSIWAKKDFKGIEFQSFAMMRLDPEEWSEDYKDMYQIKKDDELTPEMKKAIEILQLICSAGVSLDDGRRVFAKITEKYDLVEKSKSE